MPFRYEIEVQNPCEAIDFFNSQDSFKKYRISGTGDPFMINGGRQTYHSLKLIAEFEKPLSDKVLSDYSGPGFSIQPAQEEAKDKSKVMAHSPDI